MNILLPPAVEIDRVTFVAPAETRPEHNGKIEFRTPDRMKIRKLQEKFKEQFSVVFTSPFSTHQLNAFHLYTLRPEGPVVMNCLFPYYLQAVKNGNWVLYKYKNDVHLFDFANKAMNGVLAKCAELQLVPKMPRIRSIAIITHPVLLCAMAYGWMHRATVPPSFTYLPFHQRLRKAWALDIRLDGRNLLTIQHLF